MTSERITVVGAGILGLWQSFVLARSGLKVKLVDRHADPLPHSASAHAGAMLAPDCEAESAPDIVRELGHEALRMWCAACPKVKQHGSLVVAPARDRPDLVRFARITRGHDTIAADRIADLEPDLAGLFSTALYFKSEAHIAAPDALAFLLEAAHAAGCDLHFGQSFEASDREGLVIDCRGYEARDILPDLRGVRGERVLVKTQEISLSRPVRFVHPRHPLYIVPWGQDRYLIGATMIESADPGPVSVRSAMDLLAAAYGVHPAFGEAAILELTAGVRPAFPDNVPRARVLDGGRTIAVNGAYRHGYLLAPVLAEAVAGYILHSRTHPLLTLSA